MAEISCPAADILERSSSTKVGASRFVSLRHSSHELRGKFMVESPISDAQKAVSSHSNFHMRNPHFLCNLMQLFHSLTIICKLWHDLRWFEVLQTVETWWRGCPVRYIPQDSSPSWNQDEEDEEDVGLSISKNTQPSCNLPGKNNGVWVWECLDGSCKQLWFSTPQLAKVFAMGYWKCHGSLHYGSL